MTTELCYLALVATFTAFMWIPYILNLMMVRGIPAAVGYPENPAPLAPWAQRMKAAHANAVENLVVFAALVMVANTVVATSSCTAAAAAVYFWARVVHFFAYTFRVPWVRTIAFVASWAAQIAFAWQILM
ncbi:MAG: MAPEG family protein [Thermoanaerobaculales bacterium]